MIFNFSRKGLPSHPAFGPPQELFIYLVLLDPFVKQGNFFFFATQKTEQGRRKLNVFFFQQRLLTWSFKKLIDDVGSCSARLLLVRRIANCFLKRLKKIRWELTW
jgi:hypothetical protein